MRFPKISLKLVDGPELELDELEPPKISSKRLLMMSLNEEPELEEPLLLVEFEDDEPPRRSSKNSARLKSSAVEVALALELVLVDEELEGLNKSPSKSAKLSPVLVDLADEEVELVVLPVLPKSLSRKPSEVVADAELVALLDEEDVVVGDPNKASKSPCLVVLAEEPEDNEDDEVGADVAAEELELVVTVVVSELSKSWSSNPSAVVAGAADELKSVTSALAIKPLLMFAEMNLENCSCKKSESFNSLINRLPTLLFFKDSTNWSTSTFESDFLR